MSQNLVINITTKNGASQAFRTIASNAQSMGNSLKSAGTGASSSLTKVAAEANKADAALDKLGASADDASRGMDNLSDTATKVGAALGTGIAAISRFGAQAENQRRQVDGIRKAYGDAADEILAFTESVQQSTTFSNEDAREAAQIAATLAQNYGLTADEVKNLITVSADLATVNGVTLADAVQRTSSAIRGEAESAEALGLTLNQQAIDRENLTLSMSNQEAAQFRLNALNEQAAYAQGAAGEAAQTAAGQAAQFANSVQDATTNLGQALGPVAGVTAGFADLALILPVAGAGAGKLIAGLSQASGKMATLGSSAASLIGSINPIGLALTAAAAGALIVIKGWQDNEAANAALAASYDDLASSITGTMTAQQQIAAQNIRFDWGIDEQAKEFLRLNAGMAAAGPMFEAWTLNTEEQARANQLLAESFRSIDVGGMDALIGAMDKLETRTETFAITGDQALNVLDDLSAALAYNGDGAAIIDEAINNLNRAYAEGRITQAQYAEGLDYLANNTAEYVAAVKPATEATKELTEAQKLAARADVIAGLEGQSARYNALADSINNANEAFLAPSMASGLGFGLGLDDNAIADIQAYGDQLDAVREGERQLAEQTAELANRYLDQLAPGVEGASQAFARITQPGEDVLDTLQRIAPAVESAGGSLLRLSDGVQDAAQGLDAVLSTFAAIDALGQRSEQAGGIAENLVGSPDEWGTIDDLLSQGVISLEEYNAALEAGYAIQTRDANIQQDLNSIRAQQLPLLAEQEAAYGAYISRLEQAGAAEQQQALYLMDSANQAKVAAAFSTAYSASLGEIPEGVATEIIAEASQADPILASILEQFGLIEVGADGNVSVNFEDATTLQDVTTSLDRLNNTQIQIAIALADGNLTADEILALQDNIVDLDGETATVTVDVQDNTNGEIGGTSADIDELDGKGATVTVDAQDNATPVVSDANAEVDAFDGKTATATLSIEMPKAGIAGNAYGALDDAAAQDQTVTVSITADDQASSVIAEVMRQAQGLASVDGAIRLSATDQASTVIANVTRAGNNLDGMSFSAELKAEDAATGAISLIKGDAEAYATTYTATIFAEDAATGAISLIQGDATAYATTYTATLAASDGASGTISTVQGAADGIVATYTASLAASDGASGTISTVAGALAALDGSTATVYVNAVDNTGGAVGKQLGGVIQIPAARNGRVVQVGEAGPENVMLPYGSIVQPHPATVSQQATPDPLIQQDKGYKQPLMPKVDLKEAYRKGGESAKAFYDGLYAEAKQRVQDQADELNTTVYGSKEEAEQAIADYKRFVKEQEKIGKQREKGKDYDKEQKQAEKAAAKAEDAFGTVETSAETSGKKAGKQLDKGISDGTNAASKVLEKFGLSLDTLGAKKTEPDIKADTSNADRGISDVTTDLTTLAGKSATVKVKVDDSEWQTFLDEVDTAQLGVVVNVKTKDSSDGKMLGGVIQDHVPPAALGRVITVGEAGPEAVLLPYGSMVVPHPASGAQVQGQAVRALNIYGNVHVYPPNNDIAGSLHAQMTGIAR